MKKLIVFLLILAGCNTNRNKPVKITMKSGLVFRLSAEACTQVVIDGKGLVRCYRWLPWGGYETGFTGSPEAIESIVWEEPHEPNKNG